MENMTNANLTVNENQVNTVNEERGNSMANTNMVDFSDLTTKQSTTVKNRAKEGLDKFLLEKVKEYYGDENVSEVFKDNNGKGRAISVAVGTVKDEEGFDIEVCVNIELTAKAITETSRKTSAGISLTEIYDRLTEAEVYAKAVKDKQEKENKKKQEKEAKKEKDRKKREELKLAKERAKNASLEKTAKQVAELDKEEDAD